MSYWTYVRGYIKVDCVGRTQPEIEYILKSILDHMPRITGSEGDVTIHIVKQDGHSCSSSGTNDLKRRRIKNDSKTTI